ncbi:MAG: matrixin family metalloprotease [Phycisphaerales bacterium]|nr:matrixin family metalloprotease [Phycisphaerales bacterium]
MTFNRRWPAKLSHLGLVLLAALGLSGCDGIIASGAEDGNAGLDAHSFPNQKIQGEPNDTFAEAIEVIWDRRGMGRLFGRISHAEDVDVFALGPMNEGDRLIIDVGTPRSNLDAQVAVFDEQGRIAFENDDRNLELLQLDPFINEVIRRSSEVYFLAIYSSYFAAPQENTGAYDIQLTVVRGGEVPATQGQVVVLNFNGGTISITGDKTYTVGPFDTADISPSYTGMTAAVRQQINATVRENFAGLDLDVRVLPGVSLPAKDYSTVLFGGSNPEAYGIAQKIDPFNRDPNDQAIIFTEMFTPNRFGRVLTAYELGVAIGNIASHEIGHLLGLNHVADVMDLMDTTGSAETFLNNQTFKDSVLDVTISPLGTQDSLLLLLETIGWTY